MGLLDPVQGYLPNTQGLFNAANIFMWVVVGIFVLLLVGAGIVFYFYIKRFKWKIKIYQKVGGVWRQVATDKAMFMKISQGGDTVLYLKKHKKWLPNPQIQQEPMTYWYYVREDGEWFNFGMGDMDEQFKQMNAKFLDKEMRQSRTAIQRLLAQNYDKPNFLQVWGSWIALGIFFVLLVLAMWFLFNKFMDIAQTLSQATSAQKDVMELSAKVLGAVDNINSNSGLVKAT